MWLAVPKYALTALKLPILQTHTQHTHFYNTENSNWLNQPTSSGNYSGSLHRPHAGQQTRPRHREAPAELLQPAAVALSPTIHWQSAFKLNGRRRPANGGNLSPWVVDVSDCLVTVVFQFHDTIHKIRNSYEECLESIGLRILQLHFKTKNQNRTW